MEPIYNTIGTIYNTTRQADPYITSRLSHFLNHQHGNLYLDIGCGTGNYTIALSNLGMDFSGVEPSEKMLAEARMRNQKIKWLQGTAENIPAGDETYDGIIATLTIHHWANLPGAVQELYRVAKQRAKIVFFTATRQQMAGYWLNHYFPQMMNAAIVQMPSFEKLSDALTDAGFTLTLLEKYNVPCDVKDCFMYAGKHNPELYLEETVRKSISSFAVLANADEVNDGISKLRSDVESGRFAAVKKSYDNELGDYLFIVAEKNTLSEL